MEVLIIISGIILIIIVIRTLNKEDKITTPHPSGERLKEMMNTPVTKKGKDERIQDFIEKKGDWEDKTSIPQNGYGTYTFMTGITYKGNWKNGLKHGKGKEIDSSGNIINEGIWEKGKLVEQEDNKKFILKEYKQTHIVDDCSSNYNYVEDCDDLLSHFFNMKFESEDGNVLFLVCHVYKRFENSCGQSNEYKFYSTKSLDSLEYSKLNYTSLNSNDESELEEVIDNIIELDNWETTDVGWTIEEHVGKVFNI